MQLVVQWPALRREGFRFRPYLDLRDPGLRQILLLMGPGTLGIAATQINLFVTTQLATYQGVGAVSWLTYAFRLIYLPVGLFGVSIATAVLPTASRHAANDDGTAIASTVARGLGLMLVVNLPATIGLILLSDDIVRLLYERGRFLPADTTATAMVLRYYAVGLIGYSAARITAPVFYALHRSRVPVILSTVTIALNLVLAPLLVQQLGVRGLALSTSIGALFNATALVVLLARHLGPAPFRPLGSTVLRASLASVAMALAVTASHRALRVWWPGDQLVTQAFTVAATIGVGVGALVLAGLALRIAEMADAVRAVRRRLGM